MAQAPLHASDDSTLMHAVVRREQAAFATLHHRHLGRVVGVALRVLRDRAAAEDAAQDVFADLWCRPERFDPSRGSLPAFLSVQVRGRAIDRIRADSARRRREDADAQWATREGPDASVGADRAVVAQGLQSLAPSQRVAIELAFYGGQTYREVADHLGEPLGTVKSRIRTGLARLRPLVALDVEAPALA